MSIVWGEIYYKKKKNATVLREVRDQPKRKAPGYETCVARQSVSPLYSDGNLTDEYVAKLDERDGERDSGSSSERL